MASRRILAAVACLAFLAAACRPPSELRPAFTREVEAGVGVLDGTILFSSRTEDGSAILSLDPRTGTVEEITDPDLGARAPAFSPDGERFAFAAGDGVEGGIYVARPDGSDIEPVVEGPGVFNYPSWSPDGTRIVFAYINGPDETWDLYMVDADGGSPERVTTGPAHDWYPAWSPDGTRIAFTSDRDGDNAIWLLEVETGETHKLVDSEGEDREPVWSPDGDLLLYSSDRDLERWQLWAYDFGRDEEYNLLRTTGMDRFPTWSPNGEHVLVSIGYLAAYRTDGERFPDDADRWQLAEELATTSTWAPGRQQ